VKGVFASIIVHINMKEVMLIPSMTIFLVGYITFQQVSIHIFCKCSYTGL